MKRMLLVAALALAALAGSVSPASASTSCRNKIINDWEADGKIATTYSISCYKQALSYAKHIPDLEVYSSLPSDIRAAMAAAIARQHGKKVAATVGTPFSRTNSGRLASNRTSSSTSSSKSSHGPTVIQPASKTLADGRSNGGGSGVPVPLLVLGALALLLVAAGAAGTIAKRRRG